MRRSGKPLAGACALALLSGCASVPKDSGFAEVRRTVVAATQQPVEWNPSREVQPPDDRALAERLQGPLSAEQAVQIAFANNRDLQATLEELGVARAELIAASTVRNPLFHAEARFPGNPTKPIEIGVTQTLLDLLRLGSRRKQGQAEFAAAQSRVSGAVIHFAAQVRMDYYDLLAARKIVAGHDALLKGQAAAAELAARQHAAGNVSDLDLENEQSRYEEAKLEHARVELDELVARERFITDLGLATRPDLALPEDFPAPREAEPVAAEVEREAEVRRLDLRAARSEIEAMQRALGVARTAVLEGLEVGFHLEREPDGKETTGPSAVVPVPIFDRGAAQKTGARARLRQAQQRLFALTVTARSEARAALERVSEARARMAYLRDVVIPRRERILKLSQLEYNAMLRGVFQLIEARQTLATAQRDFVVAARDYWQARTELDTAISGVGAFSVRKEEGQRVKVTR